MYFFQDEKTARRLGFLFSPAAGPQHSDTAPPFKAIWRDSTFNILLNWPHLIVVRRGVMLREEVSQPSLDLQWWEQELFQEPVKYREEHMTTNVAKNMPKLTNWVQKISQSI